MKKNKKKTPGIAPFMVLLLICIGLLPVLFMVMPNMRSVDFSVKTPDAKLRLLKDRYLGEKSKNSDRWWLETVPKPSDKVLLYGIISNRVSQIQDILARYHSVSPLAAEISAHFQKFNVTLALNSSSSVAVMSDEEIKTARSIPELTFISRDRLQALKSPYAMYWRSDWGMMMRAIDHPQAVFAGFLFHELGHGLLHPVDPNTKYNDANSREYALEECQMHELETLVNDRASGGKFKTVIARILKKSPKAASFHEALQSLDDKDLRELDQSLGAGDSGFETAASLIGQYLMAIGLEYLDVHNGEEEEKVRLFRWAQTILQ